MPFLDLYIFYPIERECQLRIERWYMANTCAEYYPIIAMNHCESSEEKIALSMQANANVLDVDSQVLKNVEKYSMISRHNT